MCLLIFLWAPQVPFTPISAGWSANFFPVHMKTLQVEANDTPNSLLGFFSQTPSRDHFLDLTDIWAPRITKVSKVSKVHSWNLENSSQSIQGEHRAMPSVEPKCSSGAYFLGYGHNWGLKLHKLQCKIHGGHCQTRIGYLRWIYVESVECIWILNVGCVWLWNEENPDHIGTGNVTISLPQKWQSLKAWTCLGPGCSQASVPSSAQWNATPKLPVNHPLNKAPSLTDAKQPAICCNRAGSYLRRTRMGFSWPYSSWLVQLVCSM